MTLVHILIGAAVLALAAGGGWAAAAETDNSDQQCGK